MFATISEMLATNCNLPSKTHQSLQQIVTAKVVTYQQQQQQLCIDDDDVCDQNCDLFEPFRALAVNL